MSIVFQLTPTLADIRAITIQFTPLLMGDDAIPVGVAAILFEFPAIFTVLLAVFAMLPIRLGRGDDWR